MNTKDNGQNVPSLLFYTSEDDRGRRYYNDVRTALPQMRDTSSLRVVERFIRSAKRPEYFTEGAA